MKKIIFGLLSFIVFFSPVFATNNYSFVSHYGKEYLCYFNSSVTSIKVSSPSTYNVKYYLSPFNCGSINPDNTFNYAFNLNNNTGLISDRTFSPGSTVGSFIRFYNRDLYIDIRNIYSYGLTNNGSKTNLDSPGVALSNKFLLKFNLDLGSFLNFNPTNFNGSLYNQYFFSGINYSLGTLINSFYSPDISISNVYYTGGNYYFQSIFDDGFTSDKSGKIISFDHILNGVLVVPLIDYGYNFLTGSKTALLKFSNGNLIYNILDCYSSQTKVLSGCSVIDKGYFVDYVGFLNNTGFIPFGYSPLTGAISVLNSVVYYSGNSLVSYSFPRSFVSLDQNTGFLDSFIGTSKSFDLISDSSVGTIDFIDHGIGALSDLCLDDIFGSNPICSSDFSGTWSDLSEDGSGNVWLTIYDSDEGDGPCPDGTFTGSDGRSYIQYFDSINNLCIKNYSINSFNSGPDGGEYSEYISGSDLTGLESNINFAFSGIIGENFKFYSCPFRSPLKAFHLSSIGGLSSFLLDKFFDVNLVGPFNCLLGGILYSETDSVSLGSRLLSGSYTGQKYFNNFSSDAKNTINWILFAGMVLFFWAFRPKDH